MEPCAQELRMLTHSHLSLIIVRNCSVTLFHVSLLFWLFKPLWKLSFSQYTISPVRHVAVYKPHCDLNKKEIERIQKEENMSLPQDIDYLSLPVSLSQEVREILDRVRPSTVSQHTHVSSMKTWH